MVNQQKRVQQQTAYSAVVVKNDTGRNEDKFRGVLTEELHCMIIVYRSAGFQLCNNYLSLPNDFLVPLFLSDYIGRGE